MSHMLTLREKQPVTHDVNHYVFDRPDGFDFTPGQATELTLDKDGWRDEARPFTFTSQPDDPTLEFVIKSYPSHDGVTEQLVTLTPGDRVTIGDAWGAIEDKGPGVFIAGGAGVTPFIPILRARAKAGTLNGCTLIFSNKTEADIILKDEWLAMDGLATVFTLTEVESHPTFETALIDKAFLERHVSDFGQKFYVCGPDKMVEEISATLKDLGADPDGITFEE